ASTNPSLRATIAVRDKGCIKGCLSLKLRSGMLFRGAASRTGSAVVAWVAPALGAVSREAAQDRTFPRSTPVIAPLNFYLALALLHIALLDFLTFGTTEPNA